MLRDNTSKAKTAKDLSATTGFESKLWLAVPTHTVAHRFDELTALLMAKINANSIEFRTLATLRDTLLPKLLSGETNP